MSSARTGIRAAGRRRTRSTSTPATSAVATRASTRDASTVSSYCGPADPVSALDRPPEIRHEPLPCVESWRGAHLGVLVHPQPEAVAHLVVDVDVVLDARLAQRVDELRDLLGRNAVIVGGEGSVDRVLDARQLLGIRHQLPVEDCRALVVLAADRIRERHSATEAPADRRDPAVDVRPSAQEAGGSVQVLDDPLRVRARLLRESPVLLGSGTGLALEQV